MSELELLKRSLPQRFKKSPEEMLKALEEGRLEPMSMVSGFRVKKGLWGLEPGTVLTPEWLIPAFPRIPRLFVLKEGLRRNFTGPFYAEEKIEGYNVRLVRLSGKIVAITRRGYVCPFATDRWPDFLDLEAFFDRYPHLMVCCEVAGPENPFLTEWPPYISRDVRFFVFDLLDLSTGCLLSPEKRYRLTEEFSFPAPEVHGPFSAHQWQEVAEILKRYDREGREGLVFKERQGQRVFKYVTPRSNLEDLRVSIAFAGDLHPAYYLHRIIRLALAHLELEERRDEELWRDFGQAVFPPLLSALKEVKRGGRITEQFRIRLRSKLAFENLLKHFAKTQVRIKILHQSWEDGYLVVTFSKEYPRSTDFWASKLSGAPEVD